MDGSDVTAAAVINFAQELEDRSASFYENLAKRFPQHQALFLSFAETSRKNKVLIVRTYQETITDAIEACFSFKDLKLDNYTVSSGVTEKTTYLDALEMAMQLEEGARKFYSEATERCSSLLATIPRALRKAYEERTARKARLESLFPPSNAR